MDTLSAPGRRWWLASELAMGLLALAVVPALILEDHSPDPVIRRAAELTNWLVWLAFCVDFLVRLGAAQKRLKFVRGAWLDLALILLSPPFFVPQSFEFFRSLRAVRLLRLIRLARAFSLALMGLRLSGRALRHRHFNYVLLMAVATVGIGAIAIFAVEHDTNASIKTIGDALWWAAVTTTTVGYGDMSPTTGEGRLIAVALMLVGIAVIGAFTATLASLFFEQEKGNQVASLEARLAQIEAKLDQLMTKRP